MRDRRFNSDSNHRQKYKSHVYVADVSSVGLIRPRINERLYVNRVIVTTRLDSANGLMYRVCLRCPFKTRHRIVPYRTHHLITGSSVISIPSTSAKRTYTWHMRIPTPRHVKSNFLGRKITKTEITKTFIHCSAFASYNIIKRRKISKKTRPQKFSQTLKYKNNDYF